MGLRQTVIGETECSKPFGADSFWGVIVSDVDAAAGRILAARASAVPELAGELNEAVALSVR